MSSTQEHQSPAQVDQFKPAFEPDTPDEGDRKELEAQDGIPAYIRYWHEMGREWSDPESPTYEPRRANVARGKYIVMPELRRALLDDEEAEGRGVKRGQVYQARQWLHMLGPENPLEGAQADLEIASHRMLQHLEGAKPKEGEKEKLMLDAAGALIAASRIAEGEDRPRLRTDARKLLNTIADSARNSDEYESRYAFVDAIMLHQDLDYDDLYDEFEQHGDIESEDDVREFAHNFARLHSRHLRTFFELNGRDAERSPLPTGKAFEWWFNIVTRHKRLMSGNFADLPQARYLAALPHEDDPHSPQGTSDTLSDGRDVVFKRRDEAGNWQTEARIQLKSHAEDTTRYRKPVIELVVKDKDLQKPSDMTKFMKTTTAAMLANFSKGGNGMRSEEMQRAAELTNWAEARPK